MLATNMWYGPVDHLASLSFSFPSPHGHILSWTSSPHLRVSVPISHEWAEGLSHITPNIQLWGNMWTGKVLGLATLPHLLLPGMPPLPSDGLPSSLLLHPLNLGPAQFHLTTLPSYNPPKNFQPSLHLPCQIIRMGTFCMSPLSPSTRLQMEDEVMIEFVRGGNGFFDIDPSTGNQILFACMN